MEKFTYQAIKKNCKTYHILTAEQYPWSNLQVVTFSATDHDVAISRLKEVYGSYVEQYPERRDFAIIQAGGSAHPVSITQENAMQVAGAIRTCMKDAAAWWAEHEHDYI